MSDLFWVIGQCVIDSLIRVGIPRDLVKVLGVESQGDSKAGAFTRAFLNSHMRQDSRLDPRTLLTHKAVILDFCRPKKDKSKTTRVIPKRNSVFTVEIKGFVSHIYGSKFEHRASERSAKKFKARGTIDL